MSEQKIIDRDTYRSIKKMSREELQAFLMRYADGLLENNGKTINLREVEKDLRQITIGRNCETKRSGTQKAGSSFLKI